MHCFCYSIRYDKKNNHNPKSYIWSRICIDRGSYESRDYTCKNTKTNPDPKKSTNWIFCYSVRLYSDWFVWRWVLYVRVIRGRYFFFFFFLGMSCQLNLQSDSEESMLKIFGSLLNSNSIILEG